MEALTPGEVAAMLDILLASSLAGHDPARVLDAVVGQLNRVIVCDAILLTAVLATSRHAAYWTVGGGAARSTSPSSRTAGYALSVVSRSGSADAVQIDCMRARSPFDERDRVALELLAPRLRRILVPGTEPSAGPAALSCREREVLRLAAAGRTNKEIGRELFLAPDTVRKHLEHVYGKLGVRNRTEASALLLRADALGGATRT